MPLDQNVSMVPHCPQNKGWIPCSDIQGLSCLQPNLSSQSSPGVAGLGSICTVLQKHLAQVSSPCLTASYCLDLVSHFFTHQNPTEASRPNSPTLWDFSWCPGPLNSCGTFYNRMFHIFYAIALCAWCVCALGSPISSLFCVPSTPNPHLHRNSPTSCNFTGAIGQTPATAGGHVKWSTLGHTVHSLKPSHQEIALS